VCARGASPDQLGRCHHESLKGEIMPIYETGAYQVKPSAINKVKLAIQEFVKYLRASEPATEMYLAWQRQNAS
jgi:hypothetical protein